MCGIAGSVLRTPDATADELTATAQRMVERLRHRGPDAEGTWIDPAAGVALAHTRLAVLDLSPDGAQPMTSADGRWVVTFNGEVYDHDEHRRQLAARGHRFRGHGDTEVLVQLIATKGVGAACAAVDGMFAFAAWDRRERTMWLARDRFGEKPLYYGEVDGRLVFGSQLAPIEAALGRRLPPDPDAIAAFLRFKYVPAPGCALRGLHKLPPGTIVSWSPDGGLGTPRQWWSARANAEAIQQERLHHDLSFDESVALIRTMLVEAVGTRMEADVPLGAFLSGGVDSTAVVAAMCEAGSGPVATFTIGSDDPAYDESGAARAIAEHLGTDHHELHATEADALAVVPDLPRIYDEPFADDSQVPTTLVARLARPHVTVALTGDGGDELFGGYNRHFWSQRLHDATDGWPDGARRRAGRALQALPEATLGALADRSASAGLLPRVRRAGAQAHKLGRLLAAADPDDAYDQLVAHWDEADAMVHGGSVPPEWHSDAGDVRGVAARAMVRDAQHYLPGDILHKVDRAAMSVGLETRVPYLHPGLYGTAWGLPMEHKVAGGVGKRVLRAVAETWVPADLLDQPKTGFGVPTGRWLRGELRDWGAGLLHDAGPRHADLLDLAPVLPAWERHQAGAGDGLLLWDVLILLQWLEHRSATAP